MGGLRIEVEEPQVLQTERAAAKLAEVPRKSHRVAGHIYQPLDGRAAEPGAHFRSQTRARWIDNRCVKGPPRRAGADPLLHAHGEELVLGTDNVASRVGEAHRARLHADNAGEVLGEERSEKTDAAVEICRGAPRKALQGPREQLVQHGEIGLEKTSDGKRDLPPADARSESAVVIDSFHGNAVAAAEHGEPIKTFRHAYRAVEHRVEGPHDDGAGFHGHYSIAPGAHVAEPAVAVPMDLCPGARSQW